MLANAVGQSIHVWLTHRIREQARSHIDLLSHEALVQAKSCKTAVIL